MPRWSVVIFLALTGCTAQQRYLILPNETVVAPLLPESLAGQTWRLGEVTTRVEVGSGGQWGTAAATNIDAERLRSQLTERITSTLLSQKGLGAVAGPALYQLEVELGARELHGLGKGFALGLGLEAGVIVAGAGVGAGVGAATRQPGSDPATAALVGAPFGALAALPVAVFVALLADIGGVRGEYTATLTLRRRTDRVPVAIRRLSSVWRGDYSGYSGNEKTAKFAGDAVPEFERVLLEGVKSMLLEVNEPLALAR
ncbi:MAG: hypothetical protein Q8L14_41335 [Myxococcales bacterium]|nr:hypothetical protein [Myxococcales bacterium]